MNVTDLCATWAKCGSGCRAEQFPERRGLSIPSRTDEWRIQTGNSACRKPTPSHRAARPYSYLLTHQKVNKVNE